MARYLCTSCGTVFTHRQKDGICPDCPNEGLIDLKDPKQRTWAQDHLRERVSERNWKYRMPFMFVGVGLGFFVAALTAGSFLDRATRSDEVMTACMLAGGWVGYYAGDKFRSLLDAFRFRNRR